MKWLLGAVTGNPMLLIWIAVGAFGLGAISGGGTAWKIQAYRLGALQDRFDGFVARTRELGNVAEERKKTKEARDALRKLEADYENDNVHSRNVADIKRVRDSINPGSGLVFKGPGGARSFEAECYDRAGAESAIRGLFAEIRQAVGDHVAEVRAIVDKGTQAVIDLNTARKWAQDPATGMKLATGLQ